MSDLRELIPEPAEIQLIPTERTSIVPVRQEEKRRRKSSRRRPSELELIAAGSLMANVIQAVIIYVLQAGPIG